MFDMKDFHLLIKKAVMGGYETTCNLCLNEKLAIIDNPEKNLLSKRSEVISQCLHRNIFKLVNLTSRITPNEVI